MMHPQRRRKMLVLLMMIGIVSIICCLVLYALRQNISLFYTPTQLLQGEAPATSHIRAGGMVVPGSIQREAHGLHVHFQITDYKKTIDVVYRGILPDLFREGQGVVVQGKWHAGAYFKAHTVLAKHDENYMSPEVRAALAKENA